MRIESLSYFLEVARCGSFTQAANHLFISQQGLSRAIKALENDLNLSLFKRSDKRVHLTSAGEILLPHAQRIVGSAKDMYSELSLLEPKETHVEKESGIPEIAITTFVSSVILSLMADSIKRWGLSNAAFTERGLPDTIVAFADGSLSAPALVLIPEFEMRRLSLVSDVHFTPLLSLDIMAVCPTTLVSPRRKTLTLKELAQLPLAYNSEPLFSRTIQHMSGETSLKQVVLVSSSLKAIFGAVDDGRACALSDSLVAYLYDTAPETVTCSIKGTEHAYFGILESWTRPPLPAQRAYIQRFSEMIESELQPYSRQYPLNVE